MAPSYLSVLALASSAAAVPFFGHGHLRHQHFHRPAGYVPAPYETESASAVAPAGTGSPYLPANGSSIVAPSAGATGTGATGATGIATSYETAYETEYATVTSYVSQFVQPAGATSSDAAIDVAEPSSSSSCTSSDVTVTSKVKTTVYITPSGYATSSNEVAPVSDVSSSNVLSTATAPIIPTIESNTAISSSTSTEAAPVESDNTPPAYTVPAVPSSSEAAPIESSPAPPAYTAPVVVSSTQAAPVESSAAPPAYNPPSVETTPVAAEVPAPVSSIETSTSAFEAPAPYSPDAAPTTTSIDIAPIEETPTSVAVEPSTPASSPSSTSSAPTEAPSPPSYSDGNLNAKRGLSYNDASLLPSLASAGNMGWAYNWASVTDDIPAGVEFIPTLWGTSSDFTNDWEKNAQAAIENGSGYLFSFNEPDLSTQANMDAGAAAAGYKEHMMPFAGKAQLGSPSVTNGGGEMGLTYLQNFLDACDGCQIDFINIHWYDSHQNAEYFKSHVEEAHQTGGKPVIISEFGCTDGSDAEVSAFLEDVMPWMEQQDYVLGYSYFMAQEGVLNSGKAPSAIGQTYATCVQS